MRESRGQLYLEQKTLGADLRGDLGTEHLERDLTVVTEVVGEKDNRHPALAELATDRVAAGKCRFQTCL